MTSVPSDSSDSSVLPIDRSEDPAARQQFPSVWKVIGPYWASDEKWFSGFLVALIIGIGFCHTYVSVWSNRWTGKFYDAISSAHFNAIPGLLLTFLVVIVCGSALTVISVVCLSVLEIRWRTWLTRHLMGKWMACATYYRIERDRELENVDQRLSDDVKMFVHDTLTLCSSLIQVPVSIVTFSILLWQLSGALSVNIAGHGVSIPGYMVWAAFLYSGGMLLATHLVGRRLINMNAAQMRLEGDFRVLLVQIRENAEQIAFYRGADNELGRLGTAFRAVRHNVLEIIWVSARVSAFTNIVGQVSSVLPTVLVLPRLMSGALTLGGLMRVGGAFGQVTGTLSFFSQAYLGFSSWRAEANRLREFLHVSDYVVASHIAMDTDAHAGIATRGLVLTNRTGVPLSAVPDVSVAHGTRALVRGPSGAGKSTFLRTLAGLWPYGEGQVDTPGAGTIFVPQRSYLPTDTLKAVIVYPTDPSHVSDDACAKVMISCGLAHYVPLLHRVDRWGTRLSGGEQQRVAFARILIARPDTIYLDEATSALDADAEAALYSTMLDALPESTVISVAHSPGVSVFHERTIDIVPAR